MMPLSLYVVRRLECRFGLGCAALLVVIAVLAGGARVVAQQPIPQIDPGGPASFVTALAFSPDGRVLYAGGWDKVVRVWRWQDAERRFVEDPVANRRIPIGPGLNGAINAIAISPDGAWLAVGGRGVVAGGAGFRDLGRIIPADAMSREMKADQGVIYLFHTATREVRTLRGHYGEVVALAFARGGPERLTLVSAARERTLASGSSAEAGTVRAWDLGTDDPEAQYLAGITLPVPAVRPVLEAWRTGAEPRAVRVAIAWGDGALRMWDIPRKTLNRYSHEGTYDNVLARASAQRLVMAHTQSTTGQMALWGVDDAGGVALQRAWTAAFPPQGNQVAVPRQLSVLGPEQNATQAAVVLLRGEVRRENGRETLANKHYELRLVGLGDNDFAVTRARVALWTGENQFLPALATAPDQGWIAVAGNDDHTIHLYRASELARRAEPFQILTGAGIPITSGSFVKRDEQWGLQLRMRSSEDADAAESLIFDVANRRIESATAEAGWRSATADRRTWSVQVRVQMGSAGTTPEVLVQREGALAGRVLLAPQTRVTAFAVAEHGETPLLAVASRGAESAQLSLFDLATSREVRRLTAHTLPIRSLEFSADGRLLASAGDDGFVCVWSLADWEETFGVHGAPGIAVEHGETGLVVRAAPATAEWQPGDRIVGIVEEGQLRPLADLRELFDACWRVTPGDVVTVRRTRNNRSSDVALPVVQGIDERKPLFSLFVARPEVDDGADWPWIGFTPVGPYDSSSSDAERFLGWHINTGQPQHPASFARADQYRDQYRREGLLGELLTTGRPAMQAEVRPLPRPDMRLAIADQQVAAEDLAADEQQLRTPPRLVQLDVMGIPGDRIDRIELDVDGQVVGRFEEESDQLWTATLADEPWERGRHTLRAVLWTRESVPQRFTAQREFTYYPAAPQIQLEARSGETTSEPEWKLAFEIHPYASGAEYAWKLYHQHADSRTAIAEERGTEVRRIERSLTLQPGDNTIEVEVVNTGSSDASRTWETTRLRVQRRYEPKAPAPLALTIREIRAVDGQQQLPLASTAAGAAWKTALGRVVVSGTFDGDQRPQRGTWKAGDKSGSVVFERFEAGAPTGFTTKEPIELEPGENRLQLSAEVSSQRVAAVEAVIRFEPPLPRVNILAPEDGIELTEGRDKPQVQFAAQLERSAAGNPRVELLVNGRVLRALDVDEDGTVRADVPLEQSETRLQLRVTQEQFGQVADSEPVVVLYRRPPRMAALEPGSVGEQPFVDIAANIASPTPLVRLDVFVNDALVRTIAGDQLPPPTDARLVAELQEIPLLQGDNRILVQAFNQDGRCLAPAETSVRFTPAPPPRPQIHFLDPITSRMTTQAEEEVLLVANSKSPLRELRIMLGDRELERITSFENARKRPDGSYSIEEQFVVKLEPGINHLRAIAVNSGGQAMAEVGITYHPSPVRLELVALSDHRDLKSATWTAKPEAVTAATVRIDEPAKTGRVWLHGRVVWETPDARLTRNRLPVHVWVNGFHQTPVQLDGRAGEARERTFRLPIVLNKLAGNLVELNLPRLSTEADCPLAFQIDCATPVSERRLHLAIIGVGLPESETEELEQRALAAFQATRVAGKQSEFTTPAFSRGWIYGPLTGPRLTRYLIQGELQGIKRRVNNMSRSDPLNDVIVIYYEGGEIVYDEEQFFLTTKDRQQLAGVAPAVIRQSALGSDVLSDLFQSMGGAHLMFLDVVRGSVEDTRGAWLPENRRAALLRFAWLRGDAEAPGDARLITALGETASGESLGALAEIDQRLSERFEAKANVLVSKKFGDSLIYQKFIPTVLGGLPLGPP